MSSVSAVPSSGEIVPIVEDNESNASSTGVSPSASLSVSVADKGDRAEKVILTIPSEIEVSSVRTNSPNED